jgi:Zn-dependent protease with chaperone function
MHKHWSFGVVMMYVMAAGATLAVSVLYFFFASAWVFGMVALTIISFVYFMPEEYVAFSSARPYEGPHRKNLLALAEASGCNLKNIYVRPKRMINASAIGTGNNIAVLFNSATFEECPADEVEGAMMHEIGHHKNHDPLIYSIFAIATLILSAWGSNALLNGSRDIATLIYINLLFSVGILFLGLKVSRWREHQADVFAKKNLTDASGLARLLERIVVRGRQEKKSWTELSPSLNIFSLHPSLPERIEYLTSK